MLQHSYHHFVLRFLFLYVINSFRCVSSCILYFSYDVVRSFHHSFIHSCIHSFMCSFAYFGMHPVIQSFRQSVRYPYVFHTFSRSFIHSFLYSPHYVRRSIIHSIIHSLHLSIHSPYPCRLHYFTNLFRHFVLPSLLPSLFPPFTLPVGPSFLHCGLSSHGQAKACRPRRRRLMLLPRLWMGWPRRHGQGCSSKAHRGGIMIIRERR